MKMSEEFYKFIKNIMMKICGQQMPQIDNTPSVPEGDFRINTEKK